MAYQVDWLPGAIDDLDSISSYIAADSPAHAAAVVSRMLACAMDLTQLPYSWNCVAEWNDESVRERIVYSYRLIYRIKEKDKIIEVLAVIHGARLLPDGIRFR